MLNQILKAVVRRYPEILPMLKGRAFWFALAFTGVKSYDYFLQNIEGLVRGVYAGNVGGDFIDIMKDLILGQISDAYEQAWEDEGTEGDLPGYLQNAAHEMIQSQYDHVDGYYRDIVDARVDETPIEPLLTRAQLWANQWNTAYTNAVALIAEELGGNLIWQLGATERHCISCQGLDGVVARASEWNALGVQPQNAPNHKIECGGWHCDCSLTPTDQRRSPKAYDTILNIVSRV